jgi:hypothetical protein
MSPLASCIPNQNNLGIHIMGVWLFKNFHMPGLVFFLSLAKLCTSA